LIADDADFTDDADKLRYGVVRSYRYNYNLNPINGSGGVHYFLADAEEKSSVIEFVDGKMEVFRNTVPWQAVTNLKR